MRRLLGNVLLATGAVSVKLMPRWGADKGRFGTLISIFLSVCLVVSLIAGMVVDQIGYRPVAMAGFALTACALFSWARATSYTLAVVACVVLGLGAIALNINGDNLLDLAITLECIQ